MTPPVSCGLAWHSVGGGAADGIYLLRLDPATGSPAAGAAPLHAPGSEAENVQTRLPLACAAVCRVVYVNGRRQTTDTIDAWARGEAAPTVVAHDTAIHPPAAAAVAVAVAAVAVADGRLWVTWVSASGNQLKTKLGDVTGAGGTAQALLPPPGHDTPDETAAIARGEQLVLATEWSALAPDVNSEWATVFTPR